MKKTIIYKINHSPNIDPKNETVFYVIAASLCALIAIFSRQFDWYIPCSMCVIASYFSIFNSKE